jgi:hypothetical protein
LQENVGATIGRPRFGFFGMLTEDEGFEKSKSQHAEETGLRTTNGRPYIFLQKYRNMLQ